LRQNDAIKRIRGNVIRGTDVANNGSEGISVIDMQDVTSSDTVGAESSGIGVPTDFQDSTSNICRVLTEKTLDVISINRKSPIKTKIAAERNLAAEVAKTNMAPSRTVFTIPQPIHESKC
jgi:hypothetical protein